jgi:hypothetical protein
MHFYVIGKQVGRLVKNDKHDNFEAEDAEKARGISLKKYPRAKEILLYQMLAPGETIPGNALAEYSRVWMRDEKNGWRRAIPGKFMSLSEVPDHVADKEAVANYLASLEKK